MLKHARFFKVLCAFFLAGCAVHEVEEASYDVRTVQMKPDSQGWYHFAGFAYKGPLSNGKPDGKGNCREGDSARVEPCEFLKGARIDAKHLKSASETIARDEQWYKEKAIESDRNNQERAARHREAQRESSQASNAAFAQIYKDAATFSANLAEQDRQTNRLLEQAQREKQAKREAEQRARETEDLERRKERVMRERAEMDRQSEERRQARTQQQEKDKQQAQADAQAAALAKQKAEQRERERKAADDARMAKAAEQERKQERERKSKEEARQKEAEHKKEVESNCVLQGTGICRGAARTERKGGMFWVIQPNNCGYRLYVGICIKTKSGRDDCGADSVQPGRTTSFWHVSDDATGEFTVRSVGVLKGGDDWSCSGEQRKLGFAD